YRPATPRTPISGQRHSLSSKTLSLPSRDLGPSCYGGFARRELGKIRAAGPAAGIRAADDGAGQVQRAKLMESELEQAYRPCVGIMVVNRQGLVWIGRRADAPGEPEGPGCWWQMPQGGIDPEEDPRNAAL